MKERPILFKGEMVRAILEGRKTQTRRIVKPQPSPYVGNPSVSDDGVMFAHANGGLPEFAVCRYGKPGDRLWVRETWQDYCPIWQGSWCGCGSKGMIAQTHRPAYAATPDERGAPTRWRPPIHMPRWASRISLEVVSVRVERLNEISEADAVAEGIPAFPSSPSNIPAMQYQSLWESINGPGSWEKNPWVWVVEFRLLPTNTTEG